MGEKQWAMALIESVFRGATLPLARLPLDSGLKLGAWLGRAAYRLWAGRRRIALENINRARELGGVDFTMSPEDIARGSFENLGQSLVEMVRVYHGRLDSILPRVEISGLEHYYRLRDRGRGVVMITGHCGNWELLALVFSRFVDPVAGVARAQNNPYLEKIVENMRRVTGNRIYYKQGAVRGFLGELRRGRNVGVLIDQAVLKNEGVAVDFLGRKALTARLPALIARKTGAPVMAGFLHRDKSGGYKIEMTPEIELSDLADKEAALREDVSRMAAAVEAFIRAHPDQWLWGHRRWKRAADPAPDAPGGQGKKKRKKRNRTKKEAPK